MRREPQPAEGVTYAHKIEKGEALVDWRQPAAVIERRLRAFDPFPGAHTTHGSESIKLWAAECVAGEGAPGEVLELADEGITVACGQGALRLTQLQRAGGKRLGAADFLRGFALARGERLGGAA